jgi:hypothetical protein
LKFATLLLTNSRAISASCASRADRRRPHRPKGRPEKCDGRWNLEFGKNLCGGVFCHHSTRTCGETT